MAVLSWEIVSHWAVSWVYSAGQFGMATISGMVLGEMIERWYFEMRVIPTKYGIKSRGDVHTAPVVRKMLYQSWKLKDPTPG